VTIRYRPNDVGHDRFAISTGRRLGTAVVRNRTRRRIREIVRRLDLSASQGRDILVVARPAILRADHTQLRAALAGLLRATDGPPIRSTR
jgi:ribonuclease P protein component